MNEIIQQIEQLLQEYATIRALATSIGWAFVIYMSFFVFFFLVESRAGLDTARYRSRNFINDVLYTLLYQGGLFNILFYAPVFALLTPNLGFMRIDLLAPLPGLLGLVIWWIMADFIGYWVHRAQHTIPWLWAFHSVHHTQTRMTFATSSRIHVVEQFYVNVLMFVPFALLGVYANQWMPVYFAFMFLESAQHAQVRWDYGRAHRLIVSPAFHAMHHSTKAEEYTGNYSKVLSVWDFVFGTYVDSSRAPAAYGVEGMDVPESLAAQFSHPFRLLSPRRTGTVGQPQPVPVAVQPISDALSQRSTTAD